MFRVNMRVSYGDLNILIININLSTFIIYKNSLSTTKN